MKAVIFDMDGLIIDSEPIHSKSVELLLMKYGKTPIFRSNGLIHKPGGGGPSEYIEIKEEYKIDKGVEILRRTRRKIFIELIRKPHSAKEGLVDLVKDLKKNNIKIGIASNRFIGHIKIMLKSMKIENLFDVIVGRGKRFAPKPAPDLYLKTAKILKVDPKDCWALEDTETGIISAKAAGMKAVAVPNQYTNDQNFSKADLVVNSLKDIKWSTLNI